MPRESMHVGSGEGLQRLRDSKPSFIEGSEICGGECRCPGVMGRVRGDIRGQARLDPTACLISALDAPTSLVHYLPTLLVCLGATPSNASSAAFC
jgi:hypothetical protein